MTYYIHTVTWAGKAQEKRYGTKAERNRAWSAAMADREIRAQVLARVVNGVRMPVAMVQKSKDAREAVDSIIDALVQLGERRDLAERPAQFDAFLPDGKIVSMTTTDTPADTEDRARILRKPELHWYYDGKPATLDDILRIK